MPNPGILPFQVGLFAGEIVQVVGHRREIVPPCVPFLVEKAFAPRRLSVLDRPPVVEVVEGIQARLAGFDEPRMFVARMIDDQIEYEFHSPEMDFGEQVVEIVHRAEIGHDPAVVAYVVPVVVVRRIVDRIQPDHVDAQILDVVQAGNDSLQIADAVAVAVHEAARIDLIDYGLFPPCVMGVCAWPGLEFSGSFVRIHKVVFRDCPAKIIPFSCYGPTLRPDGGNGTERLEKCAFVYSFLKRSRGRANRPASATYLMNYRRSTFLRMRSAASFTSCRIRSAVRSAWSSIRSS